MSISFVAQVEDPDTGRWRLPDGVNREAFVVNLCNANGRDMLLALGLAPDPDGGILPAKAFKALVTAALRRRLGTRSPEIAARIERGTGGATMMFLGRREGYIEDRLGDLARLAVRGLAGGATHVAWG